MHARIIVTEAGAAVTATHLVFGQDRRSVVAQAKRQMRTIVERAMTDETGWIDTPQIRRALKEGGWWTEEGSEPYSVLILRPEQIIEV